MKTKPKRLREINWHCLRYRSNLLGADLRITNFGGGNTSSKIELPDPFTGKPARVLAVKGSGGDIGSITESGFALLYLDRLEQLKELYRGEKSLKTRWSVSIHFRRSARIGLQRRSIRLCTRSCLSLMWTICIPTGRSLWRPAPMANARWKSSIGNSAARSFGYLGSGRDLNSRC